MDRQASFDAAFAKLEAAVACGNIPGGVLGFLSHDGARITLSGEELLDLDGVRGQEATVVRELALEKGWHPIRIEWFTSDGYASLSLTYEKDDGTFGSFTGDRLGH